MQNNNLQTMPLVLHVAIHNVLAQHGMSHYKPMAKCKMEGVVYLTAQVPNLSDKIRQCYNSACMCRGSTVKPPNKGHFGNNKSFVLCREVVFFSEVQNVLEP